MERTVVTAERQARKGIPTARAETNIELRRCVQGSRGNALALGAEVAALGT